MLRLAALFVLAASLTLAGCAQEPVEAQPPLWKVEGPGGQSGWLFGTIHLSDRPVRWRTATVTAALAASDEIMVEVANLADEGDVAATFTRLSRTPGLPALSERIPRNDRAALAALMDKGRIADSDFIGVETWAAALTLARIGSDADDSRNGIDRAVISQAGTRRVTELEGAAAQLGLFDALPEKEQTDLLRAVVRESGMTDKALSESWRKGDMTAIEAETRSGLLADPELREVLFAGRNRAWTGRIVSSLREGRHPFVAVGAAHMAGPEGLPAMLSAKGYTVTRIR